MSNAPQYQYAKVIETNEVVGLGSFSLTDPAYSQFAYIIVNLIKVGTPGGSESLSVTIYTDEALTKAHAYTSSVLLSSIPDLASKTSWMLRFTGQNTFLDTNKTYYLGLTPVNYTRNGNTYYLALGLDWPHSSNTWSGGFGAHFEIYLQKRVANP